MAGVYRSDRRCDSVATSGVSCGTGWKNSGGLAAMEGCILSFWADYGAAGDVAACFLINGQSVAEITGQNKSDYDKN